MSANNFKVAKPNYLAKDFKLDTMGRDCRLCARYMSKSGGCMLTAQCVDAVGFEETSPRRYWIDSKAGE